MSNEKLKVMNVQVEGLAPIHYVIYSANGAMSGEGYWSNQDGWVDDDGDITFFSETEKELYAQKLPHSVGGDEKWLAVELTSAKVILSYRDEDLSYKWVSFGVFDECLDSSTDSFGQPDDSICYYTSYADLMEKYHHKIPLFDDVLISIIEQIYFNHISEINFGVGIEDLAKRIQSGELGKLCPDMPRLFASLYTGLSESADSNSEQALGFVAQAQAAFEGDVSSEDLLPHGGDPNPKVVEALEGCIEQMQQAQKMFEDDIEFGEALSKAENVLSSLNNNGAINKSSAQVRYWDSVVYNPQMGESESGVFDMAVFDRRDVGNLEVGISPQGGNIDDNFNVLFEINRLPGSKADVPCAHVHVGDTHRVTIFQRNQCLVLRLGDEAERFENDSIPTGATRNGVPQYEQVIVIK